MRFCLDLLPRYTSPSLGYLVDGLPSASGFMSRIAIIQNFSHELLLWPIFQARLYLIVDVCHPEIFWTWKNHIWRLVHRWKFWWRFSWKSRQFRFFMIFHRKFVSSIRIILRVTRAPYDCWVGIASTVIPMVGAGRFDIGQNYLLLLVSRIAITQN